MRTAGPRRRARSASGCTGRSAPAAAPRRGSTSTGSPCRHRGGPSRARWPSSGSDECALYLQNTGIMQDEEVERYKLWPDLDRKRFRRRRRGIDGRTRPATLCVESINKNLTSCHQRMIECYFYFYDKIATFMMNDEYASSLPERVKSMHDALRGALQIVTVELETEDDPQVIFETLNARGEPLLPSYSSSQLSPLLCASRTRRKPGGTLRRIRVPFDDEFWRALEKQGRLLSSLGHFPPTLSDAPAQAGGAHIAPVQ